MFFGLFGKKKEEKKPSLKERMEASVEERLSGTLVSGTSEAEKARLKAEKEKKNVEKLKTKSVELKPEVKKVEPKVEPEVSPNNEVSVEGQMSATLVSGTSGIEIVRMEAEQKRRKAAGVAPNAVRILPPKEKDLVNKGLSCSLLVIGTKEIGDGAQLPVSIKKPKSVPKPKAALKVVAKKEEVVVKSESSNLILGNFVKVVIFLMIAAGAAVGNYFLESGMISTDDIKVDVFSTFDYVEENVIPERGIVRFADEIGYGFTNSAIVDSINENEYVFNLASAKLWGNFTISDAKVNFVTERVVIIPDHAAFNLEFDGERVKLSVYDGDVYVGFLESGIVVDEYVDPYSSMFVNKLLVPKGTQVEIPLKKITSKLQSLLYLKLVKEFKYSAIATSERTSDWTESNMSKDAKYVELERQEKISEIIFGGLATGDSMMDDFVYWAEENLTFVPDKKYQIVFDHLFASLKDAIYYANDGDDISSTTSFDEFTAGLAGLSLEMSQSEEFLNRYDSYIEELSIFGPESDQYEVLVKLLEKKLMTDRDKYEVMGAIWHDVYEGFSSGDLDAEEALNQYYGYLDSVVLSGERPDIDFYKDYITFQNQLFDNLFLRSSVFYRDGYFAMKNVLEQEYLELFDGDEELAQELISNKIDFLKRLMKFFFDEEIEVSEAKQILSRLVEEIDELMPVSDSSVAVIELFETRLEDIADFWGYLNSPEYHISKTYGLNHQERYESYLEEKDKIWDFINIQEEVLGEVVIEVTVEDVKAALEAVFMENENISEVEVDDLKTPDERYVVVRGVIGGYPFDAVYDRDKELLNEVYTYNELVSDRAVNLNNLLSLLQERFADLSEVDLGDDEELTVESVAERAARLYIAELIAGYGFEIVMEDVSVVDELNAIYRVEEVSKIDTNDVIATFDFVMNGEKVINLYLEVSGESVVLDDEYTLDELSSIASAEEDFTAEEENSDSDVGVLR
jgi:hypothetical protein